MTRCVWWLVTVTACGFDLRAPGATVDAPPIIDTPVELDAFKLVCPMNYGQLGPVQTASVYRVVGPGAGAANWINAELDCRDDGVRTHLAVAETGFEHEQFEDAVSGASRWLGVTDRKIEGTWRPIIDGTGSWYTDWLSGTQPANSTNDNCLLLSSPKFEEAMPCASTNPMWNKGFICECDGRVVDPTAF